MANILIVDDSDIDRMRAGKLLQREESFTITFATNGNEALEQISQARPDLIVSDLQMPEMDGLELVTTVRRDHPSVPVILMTARGSEQIAAEALRIGAAGYVPKASMATNLGETVCRALESCESDRLHSHLFHSLQSIDCCFRLQNDPQLISVLTERVQEYLRCLPLGDEAERIRVSTAVAQALWIAHHHGNLEMETCGGLSDKEFQAAVQQRQSQFPATDRGIDVQVIINPEQAAFHISYDGPGFDMSQLPEDMQAQIADHSWLAGFVMIPAIFDEVTFAREKRRISLVKHAVAEDGDGMEIS